MRLFLYLLALLTGLSVADANPSARAAPVAVDSILVGQRTTSTPAQARTTSGCMLASHQVQRRVVVIAQNGTRTETTVPAVTPQRRCDRLLL